MAAPEPLWTSRWPREAFPAPLGAMQGSPLDAETPLIREDATRSGGRHLPLGVSCPCAPEGRIYRQTGIRSEHYEGSMPSPGTRLRGSHSRTLEQNLAKPPPPRHWRCGCISQRAGGAKVSSASAISAGNTMDATPCTDNARFSVTNPTPQGRLAGPARPFSASSLHGDADSSHLDSSFDPNKCGFAAVRMSYPQFISPTPSLWPKGKGPFHVKRALKSAKSLVSALRAGTS